MKRQETYKRYCYFFEWADDGYADQAYIDLEPEDGTATISRLGAGPNGTSPEGQIVFGSPEELTKFADELKKVAGEMAKWPFHKAGK